MRKWIPAVILLAVVACSLAAYSRLPEQMPIHWNARGEVDGYGSRFWGAFGLPLVVLAIWGLLRAIPYIDPRRANIEKFRDTYENLIIAAVSVPALIHLAMLGSALGLPIAMGRVVPLVVGLLLIFLGNLLPRFRSNWFIGIRTPWTLSSDAVWARTHRFGGYCMVIVGALLMIAGVAKSDIWAQVAVIGGAGMALAVVLYSYLTWRTENHRK